MKKRKPQTLEINDQLQQQQPNLPDRSPIIPQRTKLRSELEIFHRDLLPKQKAFLDLALDKQVKLIFATGPAGTAKTYLAVQAALTLMNMKRVSDLIYVRSAVESADSKIGFLPGEMGEKFAPYLDPLMEKLYELLPRSQIDVLMKETRITGIPVSFLRGRSWNAKVIIGDEAQNMTYKEIFTLITRTGEFSKVFILGDPEQADINGKSGFVKMMSHFDDEESRQNGIHVVRFDESDIVRSGFLRFVVEKVKKAL